VGERQKSTAAVGEGGIVRRTREGKAYRLDSETLDSYREKSRRKRTKTAALGLAFPLLLAATALVVQLRLADHGLTLTEETMLRYGLCIQSLGESWWRLVTHMFVHADGTQLAFNVTALLLFGLNLGWRQGWLMVFAVFLVGGVIGGLAGLVSGLTTGALFYAGAETGVHAVMAVSMLVAPRFHERDGWVPWNLGLGYLAMAAGLALSTGLFSSGEAPHGPLFAGVVSGLATAIFLVDHRYRNDYRFSAIFLLIAGSMVVRIMIHLSQIVRGVESAASFGPWAQIALNLFILFVTSLYVMVQAEVIRDRRRWDGEDELDELFREHGKPAAKKTG